MNEKEKEPRSPGLSEERLEAVAESFVSRLRRGEQPAVEEYARAHPDLADRLRELLPTLCYVEKARPSAREAPADRPSAPPATGFASFPDRIGEYRIIRELGRGGMGIVFEAIQESLGRRVAVKLLPSWIQLDARRRERFLQEARAAAALEHPGIVTVHGIGEENGVPYYVMQYVPGSGLDQVLVELRRMRGLRSDPVAPCRAQAPEEAPASKAAQDLLRKDRALPADFGEPAESAGAPPLNGQREASEDSVRLPPTSGILPSALPPIRYFSNVARLGVQVAEALAYAHEQGVVHRDIKPSNLLLDPTGRVWITDFGLAKAKGGQDLTQSGEIVGTLRYMAPERLRGWSDPRSDIYSLGLTLHELLALQPAFEDADASDLLRKISEDGPPRLRKIEPRIPKDLEVVVLKAVAREPADRYQSAADLSRDLCRFLRREPVLARPTGIWRRSVKWAHRRPAAAGLIGVIFLALATIFGLTLRHSARIRAESGRAQANLIAALESVKKMLVHVGSQEMARIPYASSLRRDLLAEALEFHRQFLQQSPEDPRIQLEAARVQTCVAEVQLTAGLVVEARESWKRGLDLLEGIAARGPLQQEARVELERARFQLALLKEGVVAPSAIPVSRFHVGKGANVVAASAEDLDSDRRAEILTCNRGAASIAVLRAAGPRDFVQDSAYPTGAEPFDMVVCNLDGKGGPDVVTRNQDDSSLSVLLNRGDGTLSSARLLPLATKPWSLAAADLDADGRDEVAVVGSVLQIAECGEEGKLSLGEPLQIPRNGNSVAAKDFDGDGAVDLVVGCAPELKGLLYVRWGARPGSGQTNEAAATSEHSFPILPIFCMPADLDADGDFDVAFKDLHADRVAVAWNEGGRTFRPGVPFQLPKALIPLAAGDLDGDGDADLAFSFEDEGLVSLLLNDRGGKLSAGRPFLTGGVAFRGTARDVDGDGQLDLVIANGQADDVAVMFQLREHLRGEEGSGEGEEKEGPKEAPKGTPE